MNIIALQTKPKPNRNTPKQVPLNNMSVFVSLQFQFFLLCKEFTRIHGCLDVLWLLLCMWYVHCWNKAKLLHFWVEYGTPMLSFTADSLQYLVYKVYSNISYQAPLCSIGEAVISVHEFLQITVAEHFMRMILFFSKEEYYFPFQTIEQASENN